MMKNISLFFILFISLKSFGQVILNDFVGSIDIRIADENKENISSEIEKILNISNHKKYTVVIVTGDFNKLPDSFYKLIWVKELLIFSVQEIKLNSKMNSLKELSSIRIEGKISKISEQLHFELLEYFYCNNSGLRYLPVFLSTSKNMIQIEVIQSKIKKIPTDIYNLTELTKINFSGNRISTISNKIYQLKNLKILSLENNRLKRIPEDICTSMSLSELYIDGNEKLNKFPCTEEILKSQR